MKSSITKYVFVILLITVTFYTSDGQQSGWRGPERSGVFDESGLMKVWPQSGPSLLWEASGFGPGYSSATVTDDAVYITGKKGEKDVLTSFSPDGKKKWEVAYGNISRSNYPESRCTPTYSNGRLYLVSGQGDMVCAGKDGKIIWSVNYFQKYKGKIPMFGVSESPLVVDDKVIGTPGGNVTAMVALNVENGNVVWQSPSVNEGTNYVNPLLIDYNGLKVIVTVTEGLIIGVNSDNGKLLWKFNYEKANANPTGDRNHTNTPLYRDGFVFEASGYEQVGVKIKINPEGTEPSVVWKNIDITPHVGGMVLLGNYIYSSTHDSNSKGRWICVDWTTGKTMWITPWHNKGSIISADGMLYIYEEKSGYVGLIKPSPDKLDVVSSFRITKGDGPNWAHPVIYKGRLFLRHGDYLAVYSIKEK